MPYEQKDDTFSIFETRKPMKNNLTIQAKVKLAVEK